MISPRHTLVALALTLVLLAGCSTQQETARPGTTAETKSQAKYDPPAQLPPAPEPAESPEPKEKPAGNVMDLGGNPQGLVADPETGLVAAGLRNPDQLALIDGNSGEVVRKADLPESPATWLSPPPVVRCSCRQSVPTSSRRSACRRVRS